MRTILFTGKGGVGKTTTAAGTAALAASHRLRTLVVSTDNAHSLADALGVAVGPEPTRLSADLWAQQVDAQLRFEDSWQQVSGYLLSVLDAAGVDPITAGELTVLPGAEEVLALLELRRQAQSGRWDLVVVDCAPTAETLRLLALPEALGWYMDRIFPTERRVVRALRPILGKAAGVPMPTDPVFAAVERLHRDLGEVHDLLTLKESSVRVVLTPEQVVLAEARRSLTTLSLFGYQVDAVVVNRIFPTEGADPWRARWAGAQQRVLDEVTASFTGLPIYRAPYLPQEPVGVTALAEFAAQAYGGANPVAVPDGPGPLTLKRVGEAVVLSLDLPFAASSEIDLGRHGDELVVTVGSYRRVLALPAAVRTLRVSGARIEDDRLRVRFAPATESERGPAADDAGLAPGADHGPAGGSR